jgi:hypothetical protein
VPPTAILDTAWEGSSLAVCRDLLAGMPRELVRTLVQSGRCL